MKKNIKHLIAALAIVCTGTFLTACNSTQVQSILSNVATVASSMLGAGQGTSYSGTSTSLCMTGSANSSTWNAINTKNATSHSSVTVTVAKALNGLGTVTIPAFTDGKVTVNQVTISGLTMTTANSGASTTLATGDNSTIDGTITVNGTTYTAANLYLESAALTTSALTLKMTIYYAGTSDGDDYSKAINFTYTGNAVTTTTK